MAISLNDHESRVSTLEKKHKVEILYHSNSEASGLTYGQSVKMKTSIQNFNIVIFEINIAYNGNTGFFHKFMNGVAVASLTGTHVYPIGVSVNSDDLVCGIRISPDGTTITVDDTFKTSNYKLLFRGIHWIKGLTI